MWLLLPTDVDQRQLRERAARLGVGVDALATCATEFALAADRAPRCAPALLEATVAADLELTRLAPTPALRRWVASLSPRCPAAADELPELCLPTRVVEDAGAKLWELIARAENDDTAILCECGASRRGLSLGDYVLKLSRPSDVPTRRVVP
jgi:hypothetical protein